MREELYLRRVKPYWRDVYALIEALGCKLHLYENPDFILELDHQIGVAPGEADLLRGGTIAAPKDTVPVDDLIHEALHWRLGPRALKDEISLMPVQLSLLRRIRCDEQRRGGLKALEVYFVDSMELGELVEQEGPRWTQHEAWRKCVSTARLEGFRLDGRLPPQQPLPRSWKVGSPSAGYL